MSLRCSKRSCIENEIANSGQIAFYQDLNNGGWNLCLGPEYEHLQSVLPASIRLVDTGDLKAPYSVLCNRCLSKVGSIMKIAGFDKWTLNFSAKKVVLAPTFHSVPVVNTASKWSKIIMEYPMIQRITASIPTSAQLNGTNTIHYHGLADLQRMIEIGNKVAFKSSLSPRKYQWRAYLFSCLKNTLLCLPTGLGKTLIANMLMEAYYQQNPTKGQVFIVPTIVLVEQQSNTIEQNTSLKVQRRSSEHNNESPWMPNEITVCTPAILNNAVKLKLTSIAQMSLLVFDEVHEANSPLSEYGRLLPLISQCCAPYRPRVLGMTASPASKNSLDMRQDVSSLCNNLLAVPLSPLVDGDNDTEAKSVQCSYVEITKSWFEINFEVLVFESLEELSRLHKFFEANWKIPINVSLKIKIDCVVKILSQAKLIAQNMNDQVLFQLYMLMTNWIDSIDLLQIFGPAKLLYDINSYLVDTDHHNDSFSNLNPDVMKSHFFKIRTKIRQLQSQTAIEKNSTRVKELIANLELYRNKQDTRILVFVERRNTAERLSRRLQDDPCIREMNPEYVVGNASGEYPKELQQEVLKKFRDGVCKVLVATSVLEQGIDVAACGVVICFDGIKSLKSIIQLRGRARKSVAKFIVFTNSEGRRRVNELTSMEVTMNYTVKQLMVEFKSEFDTQLHEEIQKFLDGNREEINAFEADAIEKESDESDDEYLVSEDQKSVIFRFFNFNDLEDLADHINSFLVLRHDQIKISRKRFICQFAVNDYVVDTSKIIRKISSGDNLKHSTWIEAQIPINDESSNKFVKVSESFDILTGFHFKNFTTVKLEENCIWKKFDLKISKNKIALTTNEDNSFEIRAIDIDGPILICERVNGFDIFLCLRNPPSFFIKDELAHFDFLNRSFNLFLRKNSACDASTSCNIRNALQYFCLQVYHVSNLKETWERQYYGDPDINQDSDSMIKEHLIKVWHSKHAAILPSKLPAYIISQFQKCTSEITLQLLLDNTIPLRFQTVKIHNIKDIKLPFDKLEHPLDYMMICRVKITPSRFIFMPPLPVPKNRVFRYYPNEENFVLVTFADEHGGNPWRTENICKWFLNVLRCGIKIGRRVYTFLGCSNSQLREGHCWFSCLDRREVYAKIGDFHEEMTAGRKLTRIALAFASSTETVTIDHDRYMKNVAPDIEYGKVCFSDGIGRGSQSLFNQITSIMNLPASISAFQIRIGGIKGVISVYDDQNDDVLFRKSMKKFESSHNILEVLNYNRSIKLLLNRHVILLLSSFGVPDEVFLKLQHDDLLKVMDALTHDERSLAFVKSRSGVFKWEMFSSARVIQEPFFRQLLIGNAIDLISGIVNHANISVKDGRVLMGVLDETETLEYGEVYAHIVEENLDMELEGKVVVFRNPSVFPSDIRVLNARKNLSPRLKKLYKNCLVIPSRGQDSHARECSGGDLDGDLYYVIWDQRLMPPNIPLPGHKVIEVGTEEVITSSGGNSEEHMMQFYCDYLSRNQLGIIANAHLAMADQLGPNHPNAIELAKYVAAETDAPKKGFTVGVIKKKLLPDKYPDYMRKSNKLSYRSDSIIGELYRSANQILDILLEKRICVAPHVRTVTSGKESIEGYYSLYSLQIKMLLQSFELESEMDLFSGTPIWLRGYMSTYKQQHQLRIAVIDTISEFWKKWMSVFEQWRSEVKNDQKQINDWYCRPKSCLAPAHSFSFLALPYIDFEQAARETIVQAIQSSIVRWINYNKINWLTEWRKRESAGLMVIQHLQGIECHFYGSSMLGLNEEFSDIDLYAGDKDFLKLSVALNNIDSNVVSLRKPHACISLTCNSFPVDVTNFVGGVQKTYGLAEIFDEHPEYWASLRVLIQWARTVRIVKSGGSQGLMTVISFCHLFIYFATSAKPKMMSQATSYSFARYVNWMESNTLSGRLIYDFLMMLALRKERSWIASKTDPLNDEPLIKSSLISELSKNAEIAIYILTVHDGDIQKLFHFCTKTRLFRIDKRYLNPMTAGEELRKQNMKEIIAKCNPSKSEQLSFKLLNRNAVYYLEVTSNNHKLFADVERGLNKINTRIMSSRIIGLRHMHAFHIVNSTMIFPQYGNGRSTEVSFSTYQGDRFMPQHTGMMKAILRFRNLHKNMNWESEGYQRYAQRFMAQITLYNEKKNFAIKGSSTWRFFGKMQCNIRCGTHYLFNIPETLNNTFETVLLSQVEESITRLEQSLNLEERQNIIRENMKNYNVDSLLIQSIPNSIQQPVALMPLQEVKRQSGKEQREYQVMAAAGKRSAGMRHSFYPQWNHGIDKAKEFASSNGFLQTQLHPDDYYTTISVYWRQREIVISCSANGEITEIRHRSTRWLSATIRRCEDGDDVRAYLEARTLLDDDEAALDTVAAYLNRRTVFSEAFSKQTKNDNMEQEPFASRPLIPEMFHFNWRFRSMRHIVPILKFVNAKGDILLLHQINDGIFKIDTREFEWFPKHNELEIRMNMENYTTHELCQQSYKFSLSLFNFTAK